MEQQRDRSYEQEVNKTLPIALSNTVVYPRTMVVYPAGFNHTSTMLIHTVIADPAVEGPQRPHYVTRGAHLECKLLSADHVLYHAVALISGRYCAVPRQNLDCRSVGP